MRLKRRSFIKQMGMMGVVGAQGLRLGVELPQNLPLLKSALAESTGGKLALLIGINKYANGAALKGAVTDVDLQRDLLINRFGFKSSDIVTLTDEQATKEAIETAFKEHLNQARADDLVLLHYSGYGREVIDSEGNISRSLVTIDQDIPESTLWLLTRTLSTNLLTLVLDTSFSSIGKHLQGDLRIRSYPEGNPLEYTLQKDLLVSPNQQPKSESKGVILWATQDKQVAAEITVNSFNAGLFTYALTQYLWTVSSGSRINIALGQTSQTVATIQQKQQPQIRQGTNKEKTDLLSYFVPPKTSEGAAAFVTSIDEENNTLQIKLTGLSLFVLPYVSINSCYSLVGDDSLVVKVKSKEGQMAKCRLLNDQPLKETALVPGSLLQETLRVIPRALPLIIALDSSLERIERVDATSALATLPLTTSIVPVGEITADCLLSKRFNKTDSTTASYALFTPSGELLPQTTVSLPNDALKSAIGRLLPQLKQLLALKLWRLTLNSYSSGLLLRLSLEKKLGTEEQTLIKQATRGALVLAQTAPNPELVSITQGSLLQYRLENLSEDPITVLLVGLDPREGIRATFLSKNAIQPQEVYLSDPETPTSIGYREIYLICSQSSFPKTQKLLETIAETTIATKPSYSLDIAQSILEDLNKGNNPTPEGVTTPSADFYKLDLKSWATFSFVYQVVEDH